MTTGTAHAKVPFVGGGAFTERLLANKALESERKLIHQPTAPQSFHNMTTGTAHAKVPYVGGGAFTERLLANKALESEKKLRKLMGMLLEAIVSSTQELEADDEGEWEDVDDDDEEDWEDIDDGKDCEDVGDEDDWEDIDDNEPSSSVPSQTQPQTKQDSSQHHSKNDRSSSNDSFDTISDSPNDNSSIASSSDDSSSDDNSSSNPSIFLSPFLSNNPPTKDYPPIGHVSFATIEEARIAYYSTLSQVENLLVKWYHKDDVTALVKTLIESAQASYAEQEEFWKDRRIVQEWFGGIDG